MSESDSSDPPWLKPTPADMRIVSAVLERRMRAADVDERRRLGALWCDRAIRVHLAAVLGDAGALQAASLARTAAPLDPASTAPTVSLLARISSAHPPSGGEDPPRFDLAVQAISRALEHLRVVGENENELVLVVEWLKRALTALGLEWEDEARAQVDDTGGLSDA